MRSGVVVPRSVAMMLVSTVGLAMRGNFPGSWVNVCSSTVIRPPDVAATLSNSDLIQSRAAPMPRFGSSCADSVLRVPKETSARTVCSTFLALTARTILSMPDIGRASRRVAGRAEACPTVAMTNAMSRNRGLTESMRSISLSIHTTVTGPTILARVVEPSNNNKS